MADKKSGGGRERQEKADRRSFDTWETFTAMARAGISLPLLFTPQLVSLGSELTRIVAGKSAIRPERDDHRFDDPTWDKNPIYKASMQTYLAWCQHLQGLVENVELSEEEKIQAKIAIKSLTNALSPSHPATNVDSVRRAVKARGASLIHGLNRMTSDVLALDQLATSPATGSLKTGKDIAATPGSVIYRNEQLELIQYKATTDRVYVTPLLLIASPVNKFYIYDLYPHNSLTHYLVEAGFQVFTLSWRNPDNMHKHWDLETYTQGLLDAANTVSVVTESKGLHLFGYSAGGIFAALLSSILTKKNTIKALTVSFAGTNFYTHTEAQVGILMNKQMLEAAKTLLNLRGIVEGKELARMFAWLRPNSLLWNAWVCNYFAGEDQPTADVRHWNNDTPRIPNALFSDFLDLYSDNYLLEPDRLNLCGHAINLQKISCDKYFIAGSSDHITPWEYCYQSSLQLGKNREFVLVNRGHTRLIICPEGSKAARFYTNTHPDDNYSDWLSEATQHQGSWWSHWANWLKQRSEKMKRAPAQPGSLTFTALSPAPGNYVME